MVRCWILNDHILDRVRISSLYMCQYWDRSYYISAAISSPTALGISINQTTCLLCFWDMWLWCHHNMKLLLIGHWSSSALTCLSHAADYIFFNARYNIVIQRPVTPWLWLCCFVCALFTERKYSRQDAWPSMKPRGVYTHHLLEATLRSNNIEEQHVYSEVENNCAMYNRAKQLYYVPWATRQPCSLPYSQCFLCNMTLSLSLRHTGGDKCQV